MTMKRMFTMLVMTFSLMVCQAQVTNQSIEQKIDSLQTQLDKLQRDYDYLNCEYKLNRIIHELSIFKNQLYGETNRLIIECYHITYDRSRHKMCKELYEARVDQYLATRDNAYAIIDFVTSEIETGKFNNLQIRMLDNSINVIEPILKNIKAHLDGYNQILNLHGDTL